LAGRLLKNVESVDTAELAHLGYLVAWPLEMKVAAVLVEKVALLASRRISHLRMEARTMPLNRDYIGHTIEADGTFEVSREHIRRFAQAIGDTNPLYTDPEAAKAAGYRDVIAPPTFLTTVGMSLGNGPIGDPGLGLEYALVVHGEQRFVHHRPVHPGDVLTAATEIEDIRDAGANELMMMRMDIRTTDGELVCEAYNLVVSRGTAASAN
jgi:acyl dehydratase